MGRNTTMFLALLLPWSLSNCATLIISNFRRLRSCVFLFFHPLTVCSCLCPFATRSPSSAYRGIGKQHDALGVRISSGFVYPGEALFVDSEHAEK